jgi:hypothetical protein
MKKVFCGISSLLLATAPVAHGHFVYATNGNNTITIIADPKPGGSVVIPSTVGGLRVTAIEDFAFDSPDVTNVSIPASVTLIGLAPFAECSNLTEIAVDPQNPVYSSTNGVLFDKRQGALVAYPAGLSGSYAIPNGVTQIGPYAFALCSGLKNVMIPDGVTNIGAQAFAFCSSLTTVELPAGLQRIQAQAFWFCTAVTNFTFAGNAPIAAASAFQFDTNAAVYYMAGTSGWAATLADLTTTILDAPNPAGSLQVTILPAAAAKASATWQVDGGPAQPSGAMGTALAVGNHVGSFNDGNNWLAPSNQTIAVVANSNSVTSATYAPLGGVEVVIAPAGAVNAGATWEVDGGAPQASGAIAYNLSAGSHVVSFGAIEGWAAPASVTVNVRTGSVVQARSSYQFGGRGVYNGLFYEEEGVTKETAGMVKGLTVTAQGTYSGRLLINGASYGLAGSFGALNEASNYISRAARLGGPLMVAMTLDSSNSPPVIYGTVSGTNWGATLTNHLSAGGGASSEYTMVLTPSGSLEGFGYLLMTNHAGSVTISGAMPDGTAVSQSVPVSATGELPFYASLYNGTGLALGWVNLSSNSTTGVVTWIKKSSRAALYPKGQTNLMEVMGSPWMAPKPGSPAIDFPGGFLDLSGGNLAEPLTFDVALGNNNGLIKLAGSATNSLSGTVNSKTGLLTITFGNGVGKSTTTGRGAVLQNATNAAGYFLGKTNAGSITFSLEQRF